MSWVSLQLKTSIAQTIARPSKLKEQMKIILYLSIHCDNTEINEQKYDGSNETIQCVCQWRVVQLSIVLFTTSPKIKSYLILRDFFDDC